MIDTIFSPSFGNRPRILVGREPIIEGICDGLTTSPGSKERSVLILGQRGFGKTVLLLEIADRAKELGFFVASPTVVSKTMLGRIVEKLSEQVTSSPGRGSLTGGSISALGFGVGVSFSGAHSPAPSFAQELSHLCDAANRHHKGILILIDEVLANHEELRQLIIAYQEMVGEGKNIALIMAGLPNAVASTLQDHVLTFLNRSRKIDLPPLKENDIDSYYSYAFQQLKVNVPDDLRRQASIDSNGSPYMMQLIGHYITTSLQEGQVLTEKGYAKSLAYAISDFKSDICGTSLAPLSEGDRAFLLAMLEDDGPSKLSDITQRLGRAPGYVQLYKRRLLQTGVIEQVKRGYVQYAIPYLKEYLLMEE